jgi:hypothetical protein
VIWQPDGLSPASGPAIGARKDLARRVGFMFEGRAEKYFADDEDAMMWAMTAARCRWLW